MDREESFPEIIYGVESGRPPIHHSLHLFSDGRCEMYLGSSSSLPGGKITDTVGVYSCPALAKSSKELLALLNQKGLLDSRLPESKSLPVGTVLRGLFVRHQNREARISFHDPLQQKWGFIEEKLFPIIEDSLAHPLRTLKIKLQIQPSGQDISPALVLESTGTEDFPLIFYDSDPPQNVMGGELELTSLQPNPSQPGTPLRLPQWIQVPFEYWVGLFDSGKLPKGIQHLTPGQSLSIPLPPVAAPKSNQPADLIGRIYFWFPGEGGERRMINMQSPPVSWGAAEKPVLGLTISTPQSRYSQEEAIRLTVRLRNVGTEPLWVNGRLLLNHPQAPEDFRDVYLDIQAPEGYEEQASFRVRAGSPKEQDFVFLQPGQTIERELELTRFYSLHLPGSYLVQAHYATRTALPGKTAWQGALVSNQLRFERK